MPPDEEDLDDYLLPDDMEKLEQCEQETSSEDGPDGLDYHMLLWKPGDAWLSQCIDIEVREGIEQVETMTPHNTSYIYEARQTKGE